MIRSFKCRDTELLFRRERPRRFRSIEQVALRKLLQIEAADRLEDLRVPPGNRLEKLAGDRAGAYSIRVNDQWRICFRWDNGAWDVEIADYH
jgi:proteic killer suppression protein